ncbi:MAG: 4-(cytidine 5'-diphospho)-2-C-methyl-D-erythritol kinase [Bacteroidales bacterium]|jgi:4-diphosphocytidyl-2-C-methyl-D-erythritol kinase|nr:4-(cytidine 5'-diphospho)-2-C-methyl-D-erythritol kinase [Bacteroidales bacterium]
MITFPNAKINLGLHVIRKRDDGFHDIETVFYPIKMHDSLEIMPAAEHSLKLYGPVLPRGENLVTKAYRLLYEKYDIPPIDVHLLKHIPTGSGLGGGSSDAAFTLLMLNEMFELGISTSGLKKHAALLGSDCTFFIENKPAIASGRGEILDCIELDLSGYRIELSHPGIHVSTPEAYAMVRPVDHRPSLREIIHQPIAEWKENLLNDFEEPVFKKYPAIRAAKEELYAQGAIYAAMSGSGSSVFGLFPK